MPAVLIVLTDPRSDGLDRTLLWRSGIERRLVQTIDQARAGMASPRPALLVVDRDLAGLEGFIRELRANDHLRSLSIVVAARGDLRPSELQLLDAGVNAILRLPAGPAWDDRLARLIVVPSRKAVRVPARLQLEGRTFLDVETVNVTVLNVSATGMLIECDRPLELRAEMGFAFFLPGGKTPLVGRGRVVRHAGAGRFGIEFDGLAPEALSLIAQLPEA
jgi:DNA-binding response OmpR family regulator